ncbi:MAG: LysR family transcriptional regulator, partial [Hyphomicrobiales bacterium]|nr:LysR family transcriptional regulator [Hyphomicrobiales bacterium]
RELQAGRLVTILSEYTLSKLMLTAVYPPTRHLSAKVRLFTDFLIERFGDRPYWDLVE